MTSKTISMKVIFNSNLYYQSIIKETYEIETREDSIHNDIESFNFQKICTGLLRDYEYGNKLQSKKEIK